VGRLSLPQPTPVATILAAAAPTLHSTLEYRRLSTEAIQRRRGAPRRHPAKYLPKRPPAPPQRTPHLPGFSRPESERLAWLATQLTRLLRRDHLTSRHVSALLPLPEDHGALPDPGIWRTRSQAAIALHMLLAQSDGGPASSATACVAFGGADTESSRLLDGIRLGRGIDDTDVRLLLTAAETLLADGLIDYQRRRDTLRSVTHLPRLGASKGARLAEVNGYPPMSSRSDGSGPGSPMDRCGPAASRSSPTARSAPSTPRSRDPPRPPRGRSTVPRQRRPRHHPTPAATWPAITRRYE